MEAASPKKKSEKLYFTKVKDLYNENTFKEKNFGNNSVYLCDHKIIIGHYFSESNFLY